VAEVGAGTARVWRLYLAGVRLAFEQNQIRLHQVVCQAARRRPVRAAAAHYRPHDPRRSLWFRCTLARSAAIGPGRREPAGVSGGTALCLAASRPIQPALQVLAS
jgi:hypothetical protein